MGSRDPAETGREQTGIETGRGAVWQEVCYWMVHYEATLLSSEAKDLREQFCEFRIYCAYAVSVAHSCGSTETLGKMVGTLALPACHSSQRVCRRIIAHPLRWRWLVPAGAGAGAGAGV